MLLVLALYVLMYCYDCFLIVAIIVACKVTHVTSLAALQQSQSSEGSRACSLICSAQGVCRQRVEKKRNAFAFLCLQFQAKGTSSAQHL